LTTATKPGFDTATKRGFEPGPDSFLEMAVDPAIKFQSQTDNVIKL
jgi:hypothetical protein